MKQVIHSRSLRHIAFNDIPSCTFVGYQSSSHKGVIAQIDAGVFTAISITSNMGGCINRENSTKDSLSVVVVNLFAAGHDVFVFDSNDELVKWLAL